MKHIFHKGNSNGMTQCPALWLHPDNNSLRINVNSLDSQDNTIDIDNIPINKWVHITIVVKQTKVEVFINGELKITKNLNSLPRQNYGNLWVNCFGGFDGYISKLRYHEFALDPLDIENFSRDKPNISSCNISGDTPPYLDPQWWFAD